MSFYAVRVKRHQNCTGKDQNQGWWESLLRFSSQNLGSVGANRISHAICPDWFRGLDGDGECNSPSSDQVGVGETPTWPKPGTKRVNFKFLKIWFFDPAAHAAGPRIHGVHRRDSTMIVKSITVRVSSTIAKRSLRPDRWSTRKRSLQEAKII